MIRDYNEIYLDTRRRLKAAGIEAAGLEARLLLAFAADKKPEEFLRDIRMYPDETFTQRAEELVRRRLAGEPAAYLTGSWSFYGLDLEINPNVLIPRADSELMVDAALAGMMLGVLRGETLPEPTGTLRKSYSVTLE